MRGRANGRPETGFTLVELLTVVIIIGILAAVAVPVFLGQRQKAVDATVQSDLKSLSTGAETYFAGELRYPDSTDDFATGSTINTTRLNEFVAFADISGYVIYGKAPASDRVWVLASYDGAYPRLAVGMTGLPGVGPGAQTFGPDQPQLASAAEILIP